MPCIFPWNLEIFAFLLLYQRKSSKQKRGMVLSHPVPLHYHLPDGVKRVKTHAGPPDASNPVDPNRLKRRKWSRRRPALIPSLPTPARQSCWHPSGQAALFSGLFLSATCKAWTHCQPWRTFLRGPESDGAAFPAVGNNSFSHEPWPLAGERLSYSNTCPSTSQECHRNEMASQMWKSFEKFKNISQNDKRTKHVMIARTSEHSSLGQSGLSMTSQVLFRPQDFHPSF